MRGSQPKEPSGGDYARKRSPRAIAEGVATVLIVLGVIMLMQPISLTLYTYSFATTLAGTVLFVLGSKLPE